jgi:hypothetical protein
MVSANGQAVFAVVARDAASKVLKGVGKSFGSLKSNAAAAFKTIAAGAAVAVGALSAFTVAAVKGAMSEERSIILTNAALRQRGFDLDALGPKVEEQVKAFERFGLEGENVRAGIEAGSRFFKSQNNLLKANATAANIAAVTDQDLATVIGILGKAAQGQTRGLKTLGIEVGKGAKLKDILAAADKKYAGIAEELANSTSGRFAAAQEKFNGAMDEFGLRILPLVNDALDFFTNNILPMLTPALDTLGDIVFGVADAFAGKGGIAESIGKVVGPILEDLKPAFDEVADAVGGVFESVGELIKALWGDGEGALAFAFKALGEAIKAAFALAKPFFDALMWLVDNVTAVVNALNKVSTPEARAEQAGARERASASSVFGLGATTGGGSTSVITNIVLDKKVVGQTAASYLGMLDPNPRRTRP